MVFFDSVDVKDARNTNVVIIVWGLILNYFYDIFFFIIQKYSFQKIIIVLVAPAN